MRKYFTFVIALLLCFSLTSCGDKAKAESAEETTSDAIQVDENIVTVDITLPASMFEDQDMSTFDPDAYIKENNFKKAVVNPDGSVTVTMTKARHKEALTEMEISAEETYKEIIGSEETPYIKNITHDKGFKTITIDVDKAGYDNAFIDMTPFAVGISAMFYQTFAGAELHSEVIVKDASTGEIISSIIYPDALQQEDAAAE